MQRAIAFIVKSPLAERLGLFSTIRKQLALQEEMMQVSLKCARSVLVCTNSATPACDIPFIDRGAIDTAQLLSGVFPCL